MADLVEGYANAFFEVARAEGALGRVEDELFRFSRAVAGNEELRQKLTDESIPVERRQGVVTDLLEKRTSAATTNLVKFVVGSGHARQLPEIVERLVARAAAERAHQVAEVRTAVPLDDDQRERLRAALSKAVGAEVELLAVVDPTVLGGVYAQIGDTVIDGTVRHRLDQLRSRL